MGQLLAAKDIQEQADEAADDDAAQTETPERNDSVDAHFICFSHADGEVYELDGRKAFPINHGKFLEGGFMTTVAKIVKEKFMDLDPQNVNFNLCALVKK